MCVCVCVCVCVFKASSYMLLEHSSPIVDVYMPHVIIRILKINTEKSSINYPTYCDICSYCNNPLGTQVLLYIKQR